MDGMTNTWARRAPAKKGITRISYHRASVRASVGRALLPTFMRNADEIYNLTLMLLSSAAPSASPSPPALSYISHKPGSTSPTPTSRTKTLSLPRPNGATACFTSPSPVRSVGQPADLHVDYASLSFKETGVPIEAPATDLRPNPHRHTPPATSSSTHDRQVLSIFSSTCATRSE